MAILLPEHLQENGGEYQNPSISTNCEFENWAEQPDSKSSIAQAPKPKKPKKAQAKPEEKTVSCEFEEKNSSGENNQA